MKVMAHNQYKKVRKEGGARVLALTCFLPADWKIVKVAQVKSIPFKEGEEVILQIVKVA